MFWIIVVIAVLVVLTWGAPKAKLLMISAKLVTLFFWLVAAFIAAWVLAG